MHVHTYVCTYVRADGWMDGWMHKWMDGLDGRRERGRYGWMYVRTYVFKYIYIYIMHVQYVCVHVCDIIRTSESKLKGWNMYSNTTCICMCVFPRFLKADTCSAIICCG